MAVGGRPAYNRRGLGRCPHCGKVRYRSRAEARAAKRAMHPGDKMGTYQCGEYWHFGHTPAAEPDRSVWSPMPVTAVAQIAAMRGGCCHDAHPDAPSA